MNQPFPVQFVYVLFNSGEVRVEIPETSCVLFPAEGSDLS